MAQQVWRVHRRAVKSLSESLREPDWLTKFRLEAIELRLAPLETPASTPSIPTSNFEAAQFPYPREAEHRLPLLLSGLSHGEGANISPGNETRFTASSTRSSLQGFAHESSRGTPEGRDSPKEALRPQARRLNEKYALSQTHSSTPAPSSHPKNVVVAEPLRKMLLTSEPEKQRSRADDHYAEEERRLSSESSTRGRTGDPLSSPRSSSTRAARVQHRLQLNPALDENAVLRETKTPLRRTTRGFRSAPLPRVSITRSR